MGTFLFTAFGAGSGLVFLLTWICIHAICNCVPLADNVALGVFGLFTIGGFVAGILMTVVLD